RAGRRPLWGRNSIVVGQVALSLILLIVSAVLLQGFREELAQGPGFRTDHLYVSSFNTEAIHYSEDQTRRFYKELLDRTRSAPGIRWAALTSNVPMIGGDGIGIVPEDYQLPRGEEALNVFDYYVSDGYFSTMAIPVLQGRGFIQSDQANSTMVGVLNEQIAKHYWPKGDALGKRFHLRNATGPLVQIVGIAKNSKYFWIAEPPIDVIYLLYTQYSRSAMTILAESKAPDAST